MLRRRVGWVISALRGEGVVTTAASPKSRRLKHPVQVAKRIDRHHGDTETHTRAHRGIEHPFGQNRYNAWLDLNVNDATAGALLGIMSTQPASKEWMPGIVNFKIAPDMGRMSA